MVQLQQILGEPGQQVCGLLGRTRLARAFYLAGGTGLALQLKHRQSCDLDFFQESLSERVPGQQIAGEIKHLFGERLAKPALRQSDQVVWEIAGVRVAFVAYPFSLLEPPFNAGTLYPELEGIRLATTREIALMKAYALGRRATFRDYVDLYFLLKTGHTTLQEIIENACLKFTLESETLFSIRLFLEQLTYMEDLEDKDAALNLMFDRKITAGEVQEFFKAETARFLSDEISPKKGPGL